MAKPKQILFVCTGNICRSPMAEAIFRHRMGKDSGWRASSAGTGAFGGEKASVEARRALAEWNIDISGHSSRPVTRELIQSVDLIVTMTEGHRRALLNVVPEAEGKTFVITSFGTMPRPGGIPDPIGGSLDVYRTIRDMIDRAMPDVILYIKDKGGLNSAPSERATTMKIALGADHGGFSHKEQIKTLLTAKGVKFEDVGTFSDASVDYPDFAAAVAQKVSDGEADQGLLICKTGIGMSMAANKFPHVRAALVSSPELARLARTHNDANVLVLGSYTTATKDVPAILDAWLGSTFEGGRHEQRVNKIESVASGSSGLDAVEATDPEIFKTIEEEAVRQRLNIELIASENYASRAVRQAAGCIMTNKYAEGYPGKRWYGGCECVDVAEQLAIDRAKQLFGAEHANVQPHSGSQANMAVYFSVLNPGDTILAMNLAHGGHLTHGHKMNFSGRMYNIVPYGVDPATEHIDYNEIAKLAESSKPKLICAGASAYSRIIDFKKLREIADSVGALLMVDMAHIAGLVAGGVHPSPVPHADFVTSTTHKTLRGPRGGIVLCREKFAQDLDRQAFPGIQGGPLMHIIAAKAICLHEALQPSFKTYAAQVVKNAGVLADALTKAGLRIVSGGTDNHLMLVDLSSINVTGKDASTALDKASITVNKNAIPFDTKSPFVTSGIRVGTPAITTRGMKEAEMLKIADFITRILKDRENPSVISAVRDEVMQLTSRFPVP